MTQSASRPGKTQGKVDPESHVNLFPQLDYLASSCPEGYVGVESPDWVKPWKQPLTVRQELTIYNRKHGAKMAEPRARAARQKGQLNFGNERESIRMIRSESPPL